MSYEVRIGFVIESAVPRKLDFQKIEQALGLGDSSLRWRIGDRLDTRSSRLRKTDGIAYQLFSGLDCDPVAEASRLLARIQGRGQQAIAVLNDNAVELSVTIRLNGSDTPPLNLDPDFTGVLNKLNIALDVDLYVFPSDDEIT
jgi:hypothetical protein